MPLAAGTLQGIRGGDLTLIASQIAVFFSYPVILYQANSIPIMNAVGTENFFWGEEYYTGLVKFIPRFLWPDKPLSFDYKLKELANYDFEGGGIYTTLCNDLYINFGYYYFIFYILWLLFIHYLYGMVMDDKRFYYSRIIALFIILMGGIASTIGSCEILLLFLLFLILYYSRVKTLFVASEFASGMIPFAATAINALAKDDRFEVHCLCVNSGIYSYRNIILQEANPVFLEYPKSKMMKLFYKLWPLEIIKHLSQLEKSINPDAVHFLTGDFTLALYICLNNKRTFYYTVHDLHPHEVVRKTLLGYLMQKYIIWGYKLCRNIIPNLTTSSYFQLKELKEIYPYKKVKYTSFPSLITSLIINGKKMPLEVSGLKEYILFFGTVDKYKGVDLLVDAYCNLTCKSLKLVIAGRGFDIETHNENIIRINRFIEDEEVAYLFKKAKFIVYPYRSATMSGVLSLAYYFNKKVLASTIPFFEDNATLNVVLFKVNDIDDLERKMKSLIFGKNLSVDPTSYLNIYGEGTLINSYWGLYED